MRICCVFAALMLIFIVITNFAYGECPPSSGVMGKDVSKLAPDFFRQVLSKSGIQYSDFAYNALVYWANQEKTDAYWNPLATTWNMESKSCLFDSNSAGVQNYVDEDTGITATANTLKYSYGFYQPIVNMLNLNAFNEQELKAAIRHWIGYSAYEDRLVNYWHDTYPSPIAEASVVTQQHTSQVTLTLYIHEGDANGPAIPGATVTGHDGSGNSFQGTTDSTGSVLMKGVQGTWSFTASSYSSAYCISNWNMSIMEDCSRHAFLIPYMPSQGSGIPEVHLVTLNLYVHEGDVNGPVISGATVRDQTGSNDYNNTLITDVNGLVTMVDGPGIWHLSAYAPGYEYNSWSQSITSDGTKHAFLKKHVYIPSHPGTSNNTSTAFVPSYSPASNNISGYMPVSKSYSPVSSIVGKWSFQRDLRCSGHFMPNSMIDFNKDGTQTWETGTDNYWVWKWVQNGDNIRWEPEQDNLVTIGSTTYIPASFEGTINGNTMSGTWISLNDPAPRATSGCWKAIKVDTGVSI
ncbi:Uncharacterised protein [uncultured archaeon]|nr:Uncharacterised protein [uncultured archaeon]